MFSIEHHASTVSKTGDVVALGITVGAFFEFLPKIAALLSVIWLTLQITRFCLAWYRDEKRRRGQRRRKSDQHGGYYGETS